MSQQRPVAVVIQSRLASTRLPAKAMLPIAGIPSVVLCALRAANTGLPVTVATSDGAVDDEIARVLAKAGIHCFRGPHEDVLLRYAQAVQALPRNAVVVRLTADNIYPDGNFIQSLLQEFERLEVDYLGTCSPQDGMPYGMSVEVFTVAVLRDADREARSPVEREHVTPWMRRASKAARYAHSGGGQHWSRLRCTLDTFDDYTMLTRVFADCRDPVNAGWTELVDRLTALTPGGVRPRCPFRERADGAVHSVLTLGTVQLGTKYGIANRSGMPDDDEVRLLLARAADAGITSVDTASAYGESESRLGRLLPPNSQDRIRIITKLDVLADLPADAAPKIICDAVDASVFRSLYRLRKQRLDTLLLHRWSHRDAWHGAAWARLLQLRRAGVIGDLGASVSSREEALAALADPEVGHLQCPVNLLDASWRDSEFLRTIRSRADVVVHARSVLLQGMLTLPWTQWVRVRGADARELCSILDGLVRALDRIDRVDLCLAYVRALPWVTSLVVGMETLEQLEENLERAQAPALSEAQMEAVAAAIPALPRELLNPALWGAARG